jgi:hypothetical protein
VPLSAIALATLDEAKAYLNQTGDAQDPQIEAAVNKASDYLESKLGPLKVRTKTWRLPGREHGCRLYAPIAPIDVTADITITIDGVAQTVWKSLVDDPVAGKDVVVVSSAPESSLCPDQFHRVGGWNSTTGEPEPIVLTYTGGFANAAALPGRFLEAFQLVLAKFFKDEIHQNPDTISFSGPGGTFTRIDSEIPRRAREILDFDRRIPV